MSDEEAEKAILAYINSTPELLTLLYDLDLLPEQLKEGTEDWIRMIKLSAWHNMKNEKKA